LPKNTQIYKTWLFLFFQPIYCEKLLRRKFKMSKKLLNEAAVRRFMGLAGMQANMVSNTVNEMYGATDEEEEMAETVEATTETATEEDLAPVVEDEALVDADAEMMGDEGAPEMELTSEEAEVLVGVLEKLTASLDMAAAPEEDELAAAEVDVEDDGAVEAEEDEEDAMAMMEEKEEEMNEDEIVQEVARRVAARILKAKKAQKEMNEALGK
jgi:hypothetical protein